MRSSDDRRSPRRLGDKVNGDDLMVVVALGLKNGDVLQNSGKLARLKVYLLSSGLFLSGYRCVKASYTFQLEKCSFFAVYYFYDSVTNSLK